MRQKMTWGIGVLLLGLTGCMDSGNGQATTRYASGVPGEERQTTSWTARGGNRQNRLVAMTVYAEDALAVNGKPCRRGEVLELLPRSEGTEIQLQTDPGCPAHVVAQIVGWLGREGYTVYILPAEEVRIEYN